MHGIAVGVPERPDQTRPRRTSRRDELVDGQRRVDAGLRALGEVGEPVRRDEHPAGDGLLQPEDEAKQRRLAAAVRPGDRDELAALDGELHVTQHGRTVPVGKRHMLEANGYWHASAFRSEARFCRISVR